MQKSGHFHFALTGVGEIILENVADPVIKDPTDVIVRLTRSAICGTDLHLVRGTLAGVVGSYFINKGTILGHEGVGVIEMVGDAVKSFKIGDRVIIPSTLGCGECCYCKKELYSQCDNANPHGPQAGTVFFGGPITTGPFDGMQAEKVRVPFADASLIKMPDWMSDDQAILLSDILPTAYMAVQLADVTTDDTVAVFGCGPVGQLVIACLKQAGVKAIFAIDKVISRLEMAKKQGAHDINFDYLDPVSELRKLTDNKGPSKIIDAVGIDAEQPACCGLAFIKNITKINQFKKEVKEIAPVTNPHNGNWRPGNGPSQVLQWAVSAVAKAGTISIIGVYSPLLHTFPIGKAMGKNLTIKMGNCNHHKYIPLLIDWVKEGIIDPLAFITHKVPFEEIIEAYKHFDKREGNWIKVIVTFK